MEQHRNRRGSYRSSSTPTPTTEPLASATLCIPKLKRSWKSGGGSTIEVKIEDNYNSDYDDDHPVTSSDPSPSSNRRHTISPLKRKNTLNLEAAFAEDGEQSEKKSRREMTEKLIDLMECPVCMDFPRSSPIFSCRNGHLICAKCQPKVACCPICRSPDVGCRNSFAEKFAIPLLEESPLNCVNHTFGCQHKDLGKRLSNHTPNCLHEQVNCPASHRKACTWQGSLISVVTHAGKNKCAQLLRVLEDLPFRSSIGDFHDPNVTIFERTGTTHWKPVFLLSQAVVRYFLYLIIFRTGDGFWYIYVRSLAHNQHSKNIRVRVQLSEAPATDETSGIALPAPESSGPSAPSSLPVFTFTGNVMSSTCSDEDVLKSGNYLFLRDDQIKLLKRGKTLFEYSISVDVRRKLEPDSEEETLVHLHPKNP